MCDLHEGNLFVNELYRQLTRELTRMLAALETLRTMAGSSVPN